jgi:hypothetical protein
LESAVGGALIPGIEVGWLIREPDLFKEPFRIDHGARSTVFCEGWRRVEAGYFTRQMAVPWQAALEDCSYEGGGDYFVYEWWPGQRPNYVLPKGGAADRMRWDRLNNKGDTGASPTDAQGRREMVVFWNRMGFVVDRGGTLQEEERATTPLPTI